MHDIRLQSVKYEEEIFQVASISRNAEQGYTRLYYILSKDILDSGTDTLIPHPVIATYSMPRTRHENARLTGSKGKARPSAFPWFPWLGASKAEGYNLDTVWRVDALRSLVGL